MSSEEPTGFNPSILASALEFGAGPKDYLGDEEYDDDAAEKEIRRREGDET